LMPAAAAQPPRVPLISLSPWRLLCSRCDEDYMFLEKVLPSIAESAGNRLWRLVCFIGRVLGDRSMTGV
jgi:hypothetical protein